MWYIINPEGRVCGYCDNKPNVEDLNSKGFGVVERDYGNIDYTDLVVVEENGEYVDVIPKPLLVIDGEKDTYNVGELIKLNIQIIDTDGKLMKVTEEVEIAINNQSAGTITIVDGIAGFDFETDLDKHYAIELRSDKYISKPFNIEVVKDA